MVDFLELMPLLTVSGGPMRGTSFRLSSAPQVIGRAPTADLVVDDPHLSRRHAVVRRTGEGMCLVDLGSTNGTWLNDRRISGAEHLTDGDVIRLGRTELRFFDPGLALTDPAGLRLGPVRRDQRPTLPLPIAMPPAAAAPTAGWAVADEAAAAPGRP
jgi:pSer/pThr/pTyr-binding forkhead associated (FHA) protein